MSTALAPHIQFEDLPANVRAALDDFRRRVLELFPGQVRALILYGSYARGQAYPESDVDVMVVVGWEEKKLPEGGYLIPTGDPRHDGIVDLAYEVSIGFGVYLSPFVISEALFTNGLPIAQAAAREGVQLWTSLQI